MAPNFLTARRLLLLSLLCLCRRSSRLQSLSSPSSLLQRITASSDANDKPTAVAVKLGAMDAFDEKSQTYLANKRAFTDFITHEVRDDAAASRRAEGVHDCVAHPACSCVCVVQTDGVYQRRVAKMLANEEVSAPLPLSAAAACAAPRRRVHLSSCCSLCLIDSSHRQHR